MSSLTEHEQRVVLSLKQMPMRSIRRRNDRFLRFIPDAIAALDRSKDRSTKVGAVVVDDDLNLRISGYNGFPRGIDDDVDARHERPAKYLWTSHAEENCIAQAARIGVSLKGCTLIVTSLFPCTTCSRLIIQSGIVRILAPDQNCNDRWNEQSDVAMNMLREAGVEVHFYSTKQKEQETDHGVAIDNTRSSSPASA